MQPQPTAKMVLALYVLEDMISCLHPEWPRSYTEDSFRQDFLDRFKLPSIAPLLDAPIINPPLADVFKNTLGDPKLRKILGCQHLIIRGHRQGESSASLPRNNLFLSLEIQGFESDGHYIKYDEKERIKKWIAMVAMEWLLDSFNGDEAALKTFIADSQATNDVKTATLQYLEIWSLVSAQLRGEITTEDPKRIEVSTSSSIGKEREKAVKYFNSTEGNAKLAEIFQRGLLPLPKGDKVLTDIQEAKKMLAEIQAYLPEKEYKSFHKTVECYPYMTHDRKTIKDYYEQLFNLKRDSYTSPAS